MVMDPSFTAGVVARGRQKAYTVNVAKSSRSSCHSDQGDEARIYFARSWLRDIRLARGGGGAG